VSAANLISCRELIDFIASYLDDELSSVERERFEAHLNACPACVDFLASYRETLRATADAFADDDAVPESVPEELVQAVLTSRRRS
jgi:anti-sigma factor RsiW